MRIQILDRYEPKSNWHEVYINGEILFEGELGVPIQFQALVDWLSRQPEIEIEIRAFTVEYAQKGEAEYMPPLRAMTGDLYWSDWDVAKGN